MSFPKAKIKRFNDIPVISSPCQTSAKKEKSKGFSSMFDRISTKSSSSAEKDSTKSSKYRLFRTPSLPRRLKFRQNDSTPLTIGDTKLGVKPLPAEITITTHTKEALEAANVEINNKTASLIESQICIEELKRNVHEQKLHITSLENVVQEKDNKIAHLEREIESISQADELIKKIAEDSMEKINELNMDILKLSKDSEHEIMELVKIKDILEQKNEENQLEIIKVRHEYECLQKICNELSEEIKMAKASLEEEAMELLNRDINIKCLSTENDRLMECLHQAKRLAEDDMIGYAEESQKTLSVIETLKKTNSEATAILNTHLAKINEEHEMRFRELESIFVSEKSKITKEHKEQMNEMEKLHRKEIERTNESAEERIRISEIQIEEQIKILEASIDNRVDIERRIWKHELEKCQKIAESEIMQSEFEKRDLKELLDIANELVRDKDTKIDELESQLRENLENAMNSHEQCRMELEQVQKDCTRILTEKYNYQLTLNNTRSTINILMDRLKKSDTDVEYLTVNKKELEKKCQSLAEEVAILKSELDEYKVALSSLQYSSSALENSMKVHENVLEHLMISEEEALQLFKSKIEDSIARHFDMYTELKKKYDQREAYIIDMKSLLDEFVTGIEIARIEIEAKNVKLAELEEENKNIKLENMTYKFKCEHFERSEQKSERARTNTPESQENEIISNILIENLINQLEKEEVLNSNIDINLSESNLILKNQIQDLTTVNKEQEKKISELKDKIKERTPLKLKVNVTPKRTPKTPKTPIISYAGKENQSPALSGIGMDSPKLNILRPRNN